MKGNQLAFFFFDVFLQLPQLIWGLNYLSVFSLLVIISVPKVQLDFDGGAPPNQAWRRRLNSHANKLKEFSVTFMEAMKMVYAGNLCISFSNNHILYMLVVYNANLRYLLKHPIVFQGFKIKAPIQPIKQ